MKFAKKKLNLLNQIITERSHIAVKVVLFSSQVNMNYFIQIKIDFDLAIVHYELLYQFIQSCARLKLN